MLNDLKDFGHLEEVLGRLPDDIPYLDRETAAAVNGDRSLLLLTIPKCGTTWLRYLIANYARQLHDPGTDRVAYGDLGRITSERERVRLGTEQVRDHGVSLLPEHDVDYFLYQHPLRRRLMLDVGDHLGPKLLAHRNPLDFIVSCYYFYFEFREKTSFKAKHPRDLIAGYTRYWSVCWRFFDEVVIPRGRAALISYDALKSDTATEMTRAFADLGIELDQSALEAAIPLSVAEQARKDEERRGASLVARLDSGSFVRDGSVGQWQSHFEARDIVKVAEVLRKCSVDAGAVLPAEALDLAGAV